MTVDDSIRQALRAMSQQGIGRPRERGLSQQDHDMFNRVMKRIEQEESIPLKDRVIVVKREKVFQYEVLGMPVQSKSNNSAKNKKHKSVSVVDANQTGALQRLHSRLSSLRVSKETDVS